MVDPSYSRNVILEFGDIEEAKRAFRVLSSEVEQATI